jgi:nickel transport protein
VRASPSSPAQSLAESVKDASSHPADLSQLEGMINRALDRKLAPVMKLIRDTRKDGPSITEIIGGIGYIFGLFGLVMYFKSRNKKRRQETGGVDFL